MPKGICKFRTCSATQPFHRVMVTAYSWLNASGCTKPMPICPPPPPFQISRQLYTSGLLSTGAICLYYLGLFVQPVPYSKFQNLASPQVQFAQRFVSASSTCSPIPLRNRALPFLLSGFVHDDHSLPRRAAACASDGLASLLLNSDWSLPFLAAPPPSSAAPLFPRRCCPASNDSTSPLLPSLRRFCLRRCCFRRCFILAACIEVGFVFADNN
ncbi:hypothetical protein LR48_Vigan774s001000 [Vigna angularis]|uniref:Uncharacterized protein n=1 Tax=Phaseolus angularis TaxID=3914 RepID=A0A0L9THZ7_PHAAN|nr:hypothetical protein LR48_Vigan774s001000 [Vigna angularis]